MNIPFSLRMIPRDISGFDFFISSLGNLHSFILSFRLLGITLNWGWWWTFWHDGASWGIRNLSYLISFDSHISFIRYSFFYNLYYILVGAFV